MIADQGEIVLILHPIADGQIKIAGLLSRWEIRGGVGRKRKHARFVLENQCGGVALVDIKVDHQDLLETLLLQQDAGADRQIIEDAETTAVSGECMVRSSSQMTGQTMLQSQSRRQQRTADGEKGALHQGCGDRKSNASLRLAIQTIPGKRFVI